MAASTTTDLKSRCDVLRSLHRPGAPLLLPNAWDVATARAVVAAGFPVVATTSGGLAATLGYHDHEGAPADEMLAAAARIARGVEVPVTVDAEAGYGMEPAELVAALRTVGAAGCNLEDSDYAAGNLRDPARHAEWLRAVREAASAEGYPLVINAPGDVFLHPFLAGAGPGTQEELVPEALQRANSYLEAGVDCVFPIVLWETDALRRFMSEVCGPVNVVRLPPAPPLAELAAMGVARVSWGVSLYRDVMVRFGDRLSSLQEGESGIPASAPASSLREPMSSLVNTFFRWYSTVRGLMKSLAPISGFVCLSLAMRAICASWGVRRSRVSTVILRTVSPVAASSRRARSANASAPIRPKWSWAARSCSRASTRRFSRRSHSP